MLVALLPASAQKIQTLDKDGQPVPYVSIMTPDARFIGITDLNGIIDDVNGADTISVSHIAYKPKLYKVNGKSGHITLEDADFGLPEITVTKKPLVYVQTYYRMYMYSEEKGIIYFRCGITDNSYDRKTKKLKADTNHGSKAFMGIVKTLLNAMVGGTLDKHSQIRMKKIEDNIKKNYPHLNSSSVMIRAHSATSQTTSRQVFAATPSIQAKPMNMNWRLQATPRNWRSVRRGRIKLKTRPRLRRTIECIASMRMATTLQRISSYTN